MTELIIFDVYGTIIKTDEADGIARLGLRELMDFYKHQLKVTCTDGWESMVESDLKSAGIYDNFDYHYYKGTITKANGGRIIKNLKKICEDCGLSASEAVFIGDDFSGRDEASAREFGVRFVKVPQFRSKLPSNNERILNGKSVQYEDLKKPFNFASVIGKL